MAYAEESRHGRGNELESEFARASARRHRSEDLAETEKLEVRRARRRQGLRREAVGI